MTEKIMLGERASRRSVLAAGVAAAATAFATSGFAHAAEAACCPTRMSTLAAAPPTVSLRAVTAGNQQAMDLARKSMRVMHANDAALAIAQALADSLIRSKTVEILTN